MGPGGLERALSVEEIRAADRFAIEVLGVPSVVLMENAGKNAAACILGWGARAWGSEVVILCGPGNNGGDGFVIARHLVIAGIGVSVVCSGERERYAGDAALNLRIIERMGVDITHAAEGVEAVVGKIGGAAIIVDALLGTGTAGSPREPIASLIRAANGNERALRISIDIPSGLDAGSGEVSVPCLQADRTITLFALKTGFATASARRVLGEVTVADIGVPAEWCVCSMKERSEP